jgi:hypothetical protein
MKKSNDPGIDYSGPSSPVNRDAETGIRYGIISQHSVNCYAMDDVYTHGEDVGYTAAIEELKDSLQKGFRHVMENLGLKPDDDDLSDMADNVMQDQDWERDESGPYAYEFEGLTVQTTSDNNLWVFKSPVYTRAQFCSPCVPGAGNLDTFCPDGPKTYCLAADWFEEGKAPYNIWSVATDELVYECE